MGVLQSRVGSEATKPVHVIVFDEIDDDTSFSGWRQVSPEAPPVVVGARGVCQGVLTADYWKSGQGVWVGIVYNREFGRLVFDKFFIPYGSMLTVQKVSQTGGVGQWTGSGVTRWGRGLTVLDTGGSSTCSSRPRGYHPLPATDPPLSD